MMTKVDASKPVQANLFKVMLRDIVFDRHELVLLKKAINWERFEKALEPAYCEDNGRPSIPVRMMTGLTFLKYMFGLSDQEVLDGWVENPYWQDFCGGEFFEHEPPTDQTVMSRWRKRAGEAGRASSWSRRTRRSPSATVRLNCRPARSMPLPTSGSGTVRRSSAMVRFLRSMRPHGPRQASTSSRRVALTAPCPGAHRRQSRSSPTAPQSSCGDAALFSAEDRTSF